MTISERFKTKYVESDTGCHNWIGCKDKLGHARFKIDGKWRSAHRVAYQLFTGKTELEKLVIRTCGNYLCVNPEHLTEGTQKESAEYRKSAGVVPTGVKHWNAKLTDEDITEIRKRLKRGERQCRVMLDYGIGDSQISRIANKVHWKHI
jgi:hypothetical protein